MRPMFNTIQYSVQIDIMVQNFKPIIKQHNHQSISELMFQIHNFDTCTENHVFDANSQQSVLSILVLVLTPV